MDKVNILMILIVLAAIISIFIFYKLSSWKIYGRSILPLKTRVLISILFPILIPVIFILGFIFLIIIVGLIAIAILAFLFTRRKRKNEPMIIYKEF